MKNKFQCNLCYKIIFNFATEKLTAPHPFIEGGEIFGCPYCKQCEEGFMPLCDHEDCVHPTSGGAPTPEGYKFLCYKHLRKYI
jgi:hypothetical protein